jgi:hypothetical protein
MFASVRRSPVPVVAGHAQDLESLAEAIVPVRAIRLGISAEQLLAVC